MTRAELLDEACDLIRTHVHRDPLPIPGLLLGRVDAITSPTSSLAEPQLAFVAQGTKRLAIGSHVVEYGPGDYLVVSVDLPVTGQCTAASRTHPFLGVGIGLDPVAIADLLLDAPPAPSRTGPALAASAAGLPMLEAMVRLLRLLDHPEDARVLAPLVQRELLWRLVTGEQADLVRQLGTDGASLALVGRAVRWIRDHYAEPFRVDELAGDVGMSTSSFHRHFRAATTMGPIQFQKKVRLQQARLLLAAATTDVSRAAFAVGYESPSQFSREYRREFGVAPVSHLRSA